MSGKKRLIFVAGLLVLSFAASCGISFFLGSKPPTRASAAAAAPATRPAASALSQVPHIAQLDQLRPREQQLTEMIRELHSRLAECRHKQRELHKQQQRIRMAGELLKKEAQNLEDLRFKLVGPLAELKKARSELLHTRIDIQQQEKVNLKRSASIYEKMDPSSSSAILKEMCSSRQEDDAAKILYYMSEKSAARLLGEMTDKAAAAELFEKLKRIRERG
jgi:flagellar motility protein MotE (MotC chaperone)